LLLPIGDDKGGSKAEEAEELLSERGKDVKLVAVKKADGRKFYMDRESRQLYDYTALRKRNELVRATATRG